ncbi:836_t:CDS:1, partial [Gigaspora margarita]
ERQLQQKSVPKMLTQKRTKSALATSTRKRTKLLTITTIPSPSNDER